MSTHFARCLKFIGLSVTLLFLASSSARTPGSGVLAARGQSPTDLLPDTITVEGQLIDINGDPMPGMVVRAIPVDYNKFYTYLPIIKKPVLASGRSASQTPVEEARPSPLANSWQPEAFLNPDDDELPGVITFTTGITGSFAGTLSGRRIYLVISCDDQKPPDCPLHINPSYREVDQSQPDWKPLTFVNLANDPEDSKVWITGGSFWMGCAPGDACSSDENPQHSIILDDYWIDKFEVSNSRYATCVAAGGCTPPNPTNSQTHTSYYGNSEFAQLSCP